MCFQNLWSDFYVLLLLDSQGRTCSSLALRFLNEGYGNPCLDCQTRRRGLLERRRRRGVSEAEMGKLA
ncbi:hypothetical protein L1987_40231 [Smallanthus sonchifolius]|uniref:Uncharacterized protein n=1 Tax=Smallanthus sonchifolius TaxID=185202 RepID=A0ACB9GTU6_9ASTR|nr:hypothetical protein L1987_40231 [Smallanthus sonchifolius]